MQKNISILGSTGSIGTQALDVVRNSPEIKIKCLSTNKNIDLLKQQVNEFKPKVVCVMDLKSFEELSKEFKNTDVKVVYGMKGLVEISTYQDVSLVLNSLSGNIGLLPTVSAIKAKKDVALANKESLVCAGELIMDIAKKNNVKIYPVDSEHSAIFSCLQGNLDNEIYKVYLTASGGPFRLWRKEDFLKITVKDALNHPNWSMGSKITIDSATLMNKGLEFIEAKWLFDLKPEDIEILVHPESIIHSMVEFMDGAVIAQLGEADMRHAIAYALNFPKRIDGNFKRINFFERSILNFEKPRYDDFPALNLAIESIKIGGTMPAVMSFANEAFVEFFLNNKITFTQIPILIEKVMAAYNVKHDYCLEDIFEAEKWVNSYIFERFGG